MTITYTCADVFYLFYNTLLPGCDKQLSHPQATTDRNQNTIPIPPVLSYSGKWLNDQRVRKTCERETHHFHGEPLLAYHRAQKPDEVSNQSDFTNSFRLNDK